MELARLAREENQRKPWRERTLFVSGRISLDLAQSGGEGEYAELERLRKPEDLAYWLLMSELEVEVSEVSVAELWQARDLRRAIWETANQLRTGDLPAPEDVETINRVAQEASLIPRYSIEQKISSWQQPASVKAALASIARDAIDLFANQEQWSIQQCQARDCVLLFVDHSRSGKRRWCAMERCGNRAKVAKYRLKKAS